MFLRGPVPLRLDRLSALFGDDGLVLTPLSQGSVDTGRDVAIDGSGRIVASGYSNATGSGYNVLAVTRYLDNGDLDASFDTDGKACVDFGAAFTGGTE